MPWKERSVMDERMRFIVRLKDGESMASLCREFGISRKTGYKILERYEGNGIDGLSDRARRPYRYANQLPGQIEEEIISINHVDDPGGRPAGMHGGEQFERWPQLTEHSQSPSIQHVHA